MHVAGLNTDNFAGHNDWRLPNYKELTSILNLENFSNLENFNPAVSPAFNTECVPGATVLTTSSCTAASSYWSSTTFAGSPGFAWYLDFFFGGVGANVKSFTTHVRAVRGGSP